MRREAAEGLLARLRAELEQPRRVLDERVRAEREALAEHVRLLEERLTALERSLAEREGLPPAARALAEQGERLALSLLDVEPGMERAVAAALRHRASALVADDVRSAFTLLERARAAGLGSLTVLVDARDPDLPVVPKEQLLSSPVPAVHARGIRLRPAARRALVLGRDGGGRPARARGAAACARRRARRAPRARARRRSRRRRTRPSPIHGSRGSSRWRSASASSLDVDASRFEAPLRARADVGGAKSGELATELRRLGAGEAELRREQAEHGQRATTIDVELARLGAEADEARRRLEQAGAEPAEGDDREELVVKLERLERRREALGRVNPAGEGGVRGREGAARPSSRRSARISKRPSRSWRSCGTS